MSTLPVQLRAPARSTGGRVQRFSRALSVTQAGISPSSSLRPYTVRKGDTLESIAQKRGLTVTEVGSYNKKMDTKGALCCRSRLVALLTPLAAAVQPGQTILLPTFKLSEVRRPKCTVRPLLLPLSRSATAKS